LETGQRAASARDIRDLCELYHVEDQNLRERLTALAKEGKEVPWWRPYDLPPGLATYVGLEAAATRISCYQPGVVPGLLHTPDYALAIHEASLPKLSPPVIEQRIELRLARQAILTRDDPPPPELRAIIDEAALHRIVGGPMIMKTQIERVIQASGLPNVTVQVLAYEAGAHPALDSNFILLDSTDPIAQVVYVEGLVGRMSIDRSEDIARYEQVFEYLQTISLNERNSVALLAKTAENCGVIREVRSRGLCLTEFNTLAIIKESEMSSKGSELDGISWRKAQRSVNNGECVELARAQGMIAIRDSKNPTGPILMYNPAEWRAFLDGAKNGEFDDLC
jgi:hypothetical protein